MATPPRRGQPRREQLDDPLLEHEFYTLIGDQWREHRSGRGDVPLEEVLEGKLLTTARKLDPRHLDDLLRILPRRYVVPGPVHSLHALREGDDVSVLVEVVGASDRRMRSRPGSILEVVVSDGRDTLTLTFFLSKEHLVAWHRQRLSPGRRIVVFGTVSFRPDKFRTSSDAGEPQIVHPRYVLVDDEASYREAMVPLPIYPLRRSATQQTMQEAFRAAVDSAGLLIPAIPERIRRARGLDPLADAMRLVHTPRSLEDVSRGRETLLFEEALVLQTIFALRRALDARTPAPPLPAGGSRARLLDARLPFELTAGQRAIGEDLAAHLGRDHPTNVLLQGDVGSGKTVIALRAMMQAVDAGHQALLLAPTEVLAEQHHRTITTLLGDLGRAGQLDAHPEATAVRLLTGSSRTAQRRRTMLDITSGEAGIVIGTHALLSESVEFASLALVVIDEQQRFGVDHRRRVRAKGAAGRSPHVIVMTATPIPRTAALAVVGDLDVLSLRESPGGRPGVTSFVVHERRPAWEARMWQRAAEEVAAGRQVFVVCPHIEEEPAAGSSRRRGRGDAPAPLWSALSAEPAPEGEEEAPPRGVVETAARLAQRPELAGLRIGMLHGRQSAEEKQETMARMVEGRLDMLVATTVIEVGVDVPNAAVMIVLDAERFGVSQLHQLRGRIGRGEHPGIAFLATRTEEGSPASQHLSRVAATHDGFELAELDLEHRGGGDLVGEEQSGLGRTLRYLDVVRDVRLIEQARADAEDIVAADPRLEGEPQLARAVEERLRDADPNVERS
ncbi:ATP-dependent DNA helicase RecG [Brachybacterium phenoliresistens]|uniref:Probable DNA 3'-5' helicase RecG n=1 Tax=Brachybacterium phenoliresistens TaxID=396014 RepID=Z9JX20_9MICO|nr:ATP-dependent DNA helicase RecG [Brachybacterium phenoliresistens]EWS82513.1 ATP-dependent DNA helicase RecG [Brachybacterium phenoliresistens]